MYMLKSNFIIFMVTLIFTQISFVNGEEKFLSLKKNKVNVRYGPSFDFPVKYIYKKISLALITDEKNKINKIDIINFKFICISKLFVYLILLF